MEFLPQFAAINAWKSVRLVGLILQISLSPYIKSEAWQEAQDGLEHREL